MSNVLEAMPPGSTNGSGGRSPHSGGAHTSLAMEVLSRLGVSVVLGWLAVAVGVVMIIVGYYLVSGTADVAEQLARFSSACVGGLTFIGVGGLLILSNHYRETAEIVDELRAEIAELRGAAATTRAGARDDTMQTAAHRTVVRVGTSRTYHDPGCVFADGKPDALPTTVDDAIALGMKPCQVCVPQA